MSLIYETVRQLGVFAAFCVLFVVVPYICVGFKFSVENFLYNIFASFTIGAFFTVALGFILGFVRLANRPGVIIAYTLTVLIAAGIYRRKQLNSIAKYFYLNSVGVYKFKVSARAFFRLRRSELRALLAEIPRRPLLSFSLLLGLASAVYVRCYYPVTEIHYGMPDLYVHTEWIAQSIGGNVFAEGVYPFGMHNIIMVFHQFFGINLVTAMRFTGPAFGIFTVAALFLALTKIFKSDFAVAAGFLFYTASNLVLPNMRQAYALPQETGMVFLFVCAAFFAEYIRTKETKHLVFLAGAFSVTVSCHFYSALLAGGLLLIMLIVFMGDIIKGKIFGKLLAAFGIAALAAAAPLVISNLAGIPWNYSMSWAIDVMGGAENAVSGITRPLSNAETVDLLVDKAGIVFVPLAVFTVLFIFYAVAALIFGKDKFYGKFALSAALFSALIGGLLFLSYSGRFSLFEPVRTIYFFFSVSGLIVAAIAEIVALPFITVKALKIPGKIILPLIAVGLCALQYANGLQQPGETSQMQYDGAVKAYYVIAGNFPKNRWTIVSGVDELCMVRNLGRHHELLDLLTDLSEPEREGENIRINIPTDDVFFFIEKLPITYHRAKETPEEEYPPEIPAGPEYAAIGLDDMPHSVYAASDYYAYPENRRVIMSKAMCWIQEYMKYFPREITVFYEDDDIAVYHLKQNDPYALNNLYIEYGYN